MLADYVLDSENSTQRYWVKNLIK